MGRFSCILAALFILPAGAAPAALLSTFSITSTAGFSLVSATYADGSDASGSITAGAAVEDGFDDFPTSAFGNAVADSSVATDPGDRGLTALASGGAGGPFGSSVAVAEGRLVVPFVNTSTQTVDLLFSYALGLATSLTGSDGNVQGTAEFELQNFLGRTFVDAISTFGPSESRTGQAVLTLVGGETGWAIPLVYAAGDATVFVPAPVPLPAGLPLLAGGLALLGIAGRRRA